VPLSRKSRSLDFPRPCSPGHLFFGTITHVEARIRQLLDVSSWQNSPVRFLLVDLSLVAGVDLSSAEAFVRVQRLLAARGVILVLCGFALDSDMGKALENVDLFRADGVELFSYLNEALECTCLGTRMRHLI
jgi:SulP family sulfate permease